MINISNVDKVVHALIHAVVYMDDHVKENAIWEMILEYRKKYYCEGYIL